MTLAVLPLNVTTAWLDGYRAGLAILSDFELEDRAATVAALPGKVAAELRRLVDAEIVYRQAARREVTSTEVSDRSQWGGAARVTASAVALAAGPAAAVVVTGREYAEFADLVPEQMVYAPVAALALVGVVAVGGRVARWYGDRRHPLAVDVDDADLDPQGLALLDRVRAQRKARGEVA
jgi:hypothetical protein